MSLHLLLSQRTPWVYLPISFKMMTFLFRLGIAFVAKWSAQVFSRNQNTRVNAVGILIWQILTFLFRSVTNSKSFSWPCWPCPLGRKAGRHHMSNIFFYSDFLAHFFCYRRLLFLLQNFFIISLQKNINSFLSSRVDTIPGNGKGLC